MQRLTLFKKVFTKKNKNIFYRIYNMLYCKLCEIDLVFTTYICSDCRKIKHYQNIYGKDIVLKVLEDNLCNSKFVKAPQEKVDEKVEEKSDEKVSETANEIDIEDTILKPQYSINTRSIICNTKHERSNPKSKKDLKDTKE